MSEVEAAARLLGPRARRDVPIGPLTTYRVGGSAALLVDVTTEDDLHAVAAAVAESEVPVLLIGRGSNLLVADAGFPGLANLEHLSLRDTRVTDAGMAHLGGLKALEFLAINRSRVSDAGLDQLRGLTKLKEIWVADSAISDEGARRFQAEMPNLNTVR